MQVVFETARLRVYATWVTPNDENIERQLYIAFRTDEDRPMVCATCLVFRSLKYVDWLEVASEYRRKRFATELLKGIENHLGFELQADGGSSDGDAFCAAWGAAR